MFCLTSDYVIEIYLVGYGISSIYLHKLVFVNDNDSNLFITI